MLYSDSHPWVPGLVRGLLLAVIGALLAFVADAQTADGLPGWLIAMTPIAVLGLRTAEAFVFDQFRSKDARMSPDV